MSSLMTSVHPCTSAISVRLLGSPSHAMTALKFGARFLTITSFDQSGGAALPMTLDQGGVPRPPFDPDARCSYRRNAFGKAPWSMR